MAHLACIDLPAFPLQVLLHQKPDWAQQPCVVVTEDTPRGQVLWVSEAAFAAGILPGYRYAQSLSLAPTLRAAVISPSSLQAELKRLVELLRTLSPDVEPWADEPGVLWLSGAGLKQLYPSASAWGRAIAAALRGWQASVTVGFSRFGTFAISRAGEPLVVLRDVEAERRAAHRLPLTRVGFAPKLRDELLKLGVRTVGDFVKLPPAGLALRFGANAARLHGLAQGWRAEPLQPQAPVAPMRVDVLLDDPEGDVERLLFVIKGALAQLLSRLAAKGEALASVTLRLKLDGGSRREELLKPAQPTLDERVVLRLMHLRLEGTPPKAGVRELQLEADGVTAKGEQLALFQQKPKRDLKAANDALAQLRAELGEGAVRKAAVRDAHLPEGQHQWVALEKLVAAQPKVKAKGSLVRRLLSKPVLLPSPRATHDDGWLLPGFELGPVVQYSGPYVVSGGWWVREVQREYGFAETHKGAVLWVYFDRVRRQWWLQGEVA